MVVEEEVVVALQHGHIWGWVGERTAAAPLYRSLWDDRNRISVDGL